jgi:hypothetical protein
MPIATRCPACGKDYQLADEQAGLRVRCRVCQGEFDIPRRPEVLEAVAPLPVARPAPLPIAGPQLAPPPALGGQGKRRLLYVAGALTLALLVLLVGCGGAVWKITELFNQKRVQVVIQEEPKRPAEVTKAPPRPELPRQVTKTEPPKLLDLNVPLPEVKFDLPTVKDLDDALKKLRSGNRAAKLAALTYINKQRASPDRVKRKQVIDALAEAEMDEDTFVKAAAALARAGWEADAS